MRIEYLKNIQYLNEYSIKYLFKYSLHLKWREYSFKYSFEYSLPF